MSLVNLQGAPRTDDGALTSDILQKLNISIDRLPPKCRTLLENAAECQSALDLEALDSTCISLYRSRQITEKLEDEYELLKLKQKNLELQKKIDRNKKFLADLRKDVECSKQSLFSQNPNPDNIQDSLRQLKQKLMAYEQNYESAKKKYSSLNVPGEVLPDALGSQLASLLELRQAAGALRDRAEDVTFMQQTMTNMRLLK